MESLLTCKRLRNEFRKIPEDLMCEITGKNQITFFNCKYNLIISITASKYYPFKMPSATINGIDYNLILCDSTFSSKNMVKISKHECMCCSSILCSNNWHLEKGFLDIYKEIDENFGYKKRCVELLHADKIIEKYLFPDCEMREYL